MNVKISYYSQNKQRFRSSTSLTNWSKFVWGEAGSELLRIIYFNLIPETLIMILLYSGIHPKSQCISALHPFQYRGVDKSLARPGRKQATATEDFDVHIPYL
jgi:hypothetical protein